MAVLVGEVEPPAAEVVKVSVCENDPDGKFLVSATAPARSKSTPSDICSPAANVPEAGEVVNFDDDTAVVNDTGKGFGLTRATFTDVPFGPKSSLVFET